MGQQQPASDQLLSKALGLDSAVIDEIVDRLTDVLAERVVRAIGTERLIAGARVPGVWLDAQEVAHRLGVSREWVYEHADELGAMRIGSGPRPRLRFPAANLDQPLGQSTRRAEPNGPREPRRPQSGLIPIHES